MNYDNQKLIIDGLSKAYSFIQISDCHIYVNSPENDEIDRQLTEERISEKAWQVLPKTSTEMFCEALEDADNENVDALIIAGDAVDYVSPANISFLRDKFSKTKTEILYVFGNHEGGHYKKKIDPRSCYPYYDGLMPGDPDFWVKDYGELLVVGMDNSDHNLTESQIEKLKQQCARNVPIILVIHTPIASEDIQGRVKAAWGNSADWFMLGYDEKRTQGYTKDFFDIVMSPESPIKAVLAGHDHFAYAGPIPGGRMQYVSAPSFTGYALKLIVTGK